jgi:hypothetical protein
MSPVIDIEAAPADVARVTPEGRLTRRHIVLAGALFPAAPVGLAACSSGRESSKYDETAARARQPMLMAPGGTVPLRELVRYATLAPSSHNTQCWKFSMAGDTVELRPDLSRRCPAVDPDDHHLFVSLGCATENLFQAALANGLHSEVVFESSPEDVLRIGLAQTRAVASPWFDAIPGRQCTRAEFDGRPLSVAELSQLEQAAAGPGVSIRLLTDKPNMERVLEYVVAGNSLQMNDATFMKELKQWIRFSDAEAVRASDGLATRTTGNPSLPRWLASPLFGVFVSADSENDKYAKHIRSSAGIAVFVSDVDDKAHWIEAGRRYERFALQATALGIRTAFVNQPVEIASMRPRFASLLGISGKRPDLVVRFGRGPTMPSSLRRDVGSVLA